LSGHSKWATIKRKKGANDAARAKIWTKIAREILVAVKEGNSGDPNINPRLRDAIAKARANNMPNDNIQRNIKKGEGGAEGTNFSEVLYEGYGPGSVAIIVHGNTDNKNRTAADIRHAFDKCGGSLGQSGSVAFMFDQMGEIQVKRDDKVDDMDDFELNAIDAGADDIDLEDDEKISVYTKLDAMKEATDKLTKLGYTIMDSDVTYLPQTEVKIDDEKKREQFERLIDMLDENDDVVDVFTNYSE